MLKDLNLSQSAAKSTDCHTELGAKATAIYQRFVDDHHDQMDFSGIIKMVYDE